MQDRLSNSCQQISSRVNDLVVNQGQTLLKIGHELTEIFTRGGQLILAGNGALMAVAQQTAVAFSHRLSFERPPLPAIALGSNPFFTAALLADQQAQEILSREYRSYSDQEHMLLIFCDQQPSPQIDHLIDQIEDTRLLVIIGPAPEGGWPDAHKPGLSLNLNGDSPARLTELGIICGHLICELVEGELFGV